MEDGRALVAVEGANKWFGDVHALVDVDLTIERGEVVVVIGPSGSGKSTLCRAINRLEPLDSGRVLFDEPTSALDPEMIKEVLDVMVELAADGTTMLVVSHEMGFARSAARRVAFMDDGRIVEVAPPEKFFDHPDSARARDFLSKVLAH